MKIIFLDIDGVLNSTEYIISLKGNFNSVDKVYQIDPKAVVRLNKITDATSASIVVSSTWRMFYKYMADLRGVLVEAGITGKVIDKTPVNNNIRGAQIAEWIDKQNKRSDKVEQFIILDDDSDMGNLMKYLIKTSHSDGLQDHHVELAIKRLNDS